MDDDNFPPNMAPAYAPPPLPLGTPVPSRQWDDTGSDGQTYEDALVEYVLAETRIVHAPIDQACAQWAFEDATTPTQAVRDGSGRARICKAYPTEILDLDLRRWLRQKWPTASKCVEDVGENLPVVVSLFEVFMGGWSTVVRGAFQDCNKWAVRRGTGMGEQAGAILWSPWTLKCEPRWTLTPRGVRPTLPR